jgi:hypothetical protein
MSVRLCQPSLQHSERVEKFYVVVSTQRHAEQTRVIEWNKDRNIQGTVQLSPEQPASARVVYLDSIEVASSRRALIVDSPRHTTYHIPHTTYHILNPDGRDIQGTHTFLYFPPFFVCTSLASIESSGSHIWPNVSPSRHHHTLTDLSQKLSSHNTRSLSGVLAHMKIRRVIKVKFGERLVNK